VSRWRATPRQLAILLSGLWLFGIGEALLIESRLGNSPWTVFAEGAGEQTGIGVGAATVATSFLILAAWIPLRQQPGLGTIANALVIGISIGVTIEVVPDLDSLGPRVGQVVVGIGIVAIGSGLYLMTRLGAGPRDGLMLGLHRRTGLSVRLIRTGIEGSATAAGALLGGKVGLGTLAFAVLIGPGVQAALGVLSSTPAHEL
jgi:uncharacterized membrane protein YczE